MRIDEGMDTGDILTQRAVPVSDTCSTGELEEWLADEGATLLMETIGGYVSGEITPRSQSSEGVSYAPRISKEEGRISWKNHALEIHNRVRAMNPWPVAHSLFRGETLKVWRTEVGEHSEVSETHPLEGTVVEIAEGRVMIRCEGFSNLNLLTVQLPNRKKVSAIDFANGTQLQVGESLG
jgi:methionyl-tRNA formyltransferase